MLRSDSVLQNKVDATTQHRSSPQTPMSNENEPKQADPDAEVSIKDLISSYQTKMEEVRNKMFPAILRYEFSWALFIIFVVPCHIVFNYVILIFC